MSARILVVDDQPIVYHGLREILSDEHGLELCGQASDPVEAMRELKRQRPAMVVLDIALGNGSGIRLIDQIMKAAPHVRILVFTTHNDAELVEMTLRAGAMGYLTKSDPASVLVEAIRRLLDGGFHFPQELTERLLGRNSHHLAASTRCPREALSRQELKVFVLIGQGFTIRQIAKKLDVCARTIETHRQNIKRKLGVANSAQLVQRAVSWVQRIGPALDIGDAM